MITLEKVAKSFGDLQVLKDISFTVARGEVACLIGPSGSGKSTALRCINGLEVYDGGVIQVDGQRVGAENLPSIRRRIAMVFQRFNLFPHRTVIENIIEGPVFSLGKPVAEAREMGMDLLEKVEMADKATSYPAELSGGQQQRVGIARALAMQPEAILFDEPTSALDPERVGEVLNVMRELASDGMTMIVVTHEMRFARDVADKAIFMADGYVVESGPAVEVLTRPQQERTRQFLDRILALD